MRLILTWRRWALVDIEVLLAQPIQDKNAEQETDDEYDTTADAHSINFGFGV